MSSSQWRGDLTLPKVLLGFESSNWNHSCYLLAQLAAKVAGVVLVCAACEQGAAGEGREATIGNFGREFTVSLREG